MGNKNKTIKKIEKDNQKYLVAPEKPQKSLDSGLS